MQLPTQDVQDEYMKAQREQVLNSLVTQRFEVEVEKEWLKTRKEKAQKRASEDIIDQKGKVIEGQEEYIAMLSDKLGDTLEPSKEAMEEFYDAKILEAQKGNFRGSLGAELQKRRLKKTKEVDIVRVAEDDIEQIENDIAKNDVLIRVAEKLKKAL